MNKKVYKEVSERADGNCENCYINTHLELHHIFGRLVEESLDTCMMLCITCHRSSEGVHGTNGYPLSLKFKQQAQRGLLDKGYTVDEVRVMTGGKYYL